MQELKKELRREAGYVGFSLVLYIALSNLVHLLCYGLVAARGSEALLIVYEMAVYALGLGAAIAFLRLTGPKERAPRERGGRGWLWLVVPIYLAVFVCYVTINLVPNIVFGFFGISEPSAALDVPTQPLLLALYIVQSVVLPALLEEWLFRGEILNRLRRFGDWTAVVVSAFVFGILHGSLLNLGGFFFFGLVLGYIAIKSGSLMPGVLIHALNNLGAVVAYSVGDEAYAQIVGYELVLGVVSVALLLVLAFGRGGAREKNLRISRPALPMRGAFVSAGMIILMLVCGFLMVRQLEVNAVL